MRVRVYVREFHVRCLGLEVSIWKLRSLGFTSVFGGLRAFLLGIGLKDLICLAPRDRYDIQIANPITNVSSVMFLHMLRDMGINRSYYPELCFAHSRAPWSLEGRSHQSLESLLPGLRSQVATFRKYRAA